MKLLNKEQLMITPVERIADLIPIGKLTLVLGLQGTGKSTTILKALISSDVKPIWFNYDESEAPVDISKVLIYSGGLGLDFILGNYKDVRDSFILLDTYERMWEQISEWNLLQEEKLNKEELKLFLVNQLESNCKKFNNTVLVLAHPKEYVGRDGIFTDNETLARRAYEILSFETKLSTSIKDIKAGKAETKILYVKKGRGYQGKRMLLNWMRDTDDKPKNFDKVTYTKGE